MSHSWREKEGKLIHDGDCYFWDIKICTCGLLHHLMPIHENKSAIYHGDYAQALAEQSNAYSHLLRHRPPPLVPITEEEFNHFWSVIEQTFGVDNPPGTEEST